MSIKKEELERAITLKVFTCRACKIEKPFSEFPTYSPLKLLGIYHNYRKCCTAIRAAGNQGKRMSEEEKERRFKEQMKICSKCKIDKSFSCFSKEPNNRTTFELSSTCLNCLNIRSKEKLKRTPRDEVYRKNKKYDLKKNYGMEVEEFDKKNIEQNGVCEICKQPETIIYKGNNTARRLSVDHNHTTGQIRGLLCTSCNTAIGLTYENVEILHSIILYLKKYEEKAKEIINDSEISN